MLPLAVTHNRKPANIAATRDRRSLPGAMGEKEAVLEGRQQAGAAHARREAGVMNQTPCGSGGYGRCVGVDAT